MRERFESRLGLDLSGVHIHTDDEMSEKSRLVQVVSDEQESHVRGLLLEYVRWLQEETIGGAQAKPPRG